MNLSTLVRSKRGQAIGAVLALAGGIGIGSILSITTHSTAAQSPLEITPSAHVIGATLARQPTPQLKGLTDQNGNQISLDQEKGRVVLLAFMDPLCVNLCPVLGREIAAVEQALPTSIRPVLLIVSVTSGRTSSDVQHFVSTNLSTQWLPGWHWLIGPGDAALKLSWLAWGVPIEPPKTNFLDIIDAQGYLRVTYPAPLYVDDVVSAVTKIASGYVPK